MNEQRNGEVIWRANDPGGREGAVVRRTPFLTHCHDAVNGTRYRGGQVVALTEAAISVRYQAEATMTLEQSVARALMPTVRLGDPVIVELASSTYTIAALHAGAFAGPGPSGNQEASVAAGEYFPSRITEALWNS